MNSNLKIVLILALGILLGIIIHRYVIAASDEVMRFGRPGDYELLSRAITYDDAKTCIEGYMKDLKPIFMRGSDNQRLQGWSIDTTLFYNLQQKHGKDNIAGYQLYLAKFEQPGLSNDYYSLVIGAYKEVNGNIELLLTNNPANCNDCLYEYLSPCPDICPVRTSYYDKPWIDKKYW